MSDLTKDILDQPSPLPLETEKIHSDALTRMAGRGALWQLLGGGWQTIVQLAASAVLARVLFPEDFGMLGMAVLGKGLIALVSIGTGAGVIAKKEATQEDLSTAFWTEIGMQGLLFIVAIAAAPLAAMFFRNPPLTWVLRAIAFTFLLSGAGSVSGMLLRKRLKFGALKTIECVGFTLQSGLAVVFAVVFDLGYWALVLAILIADFCQTAACIVYARWIPSFCFNRTSFRYLWRYGIHGLGSHLAMYFQSNIDYILVGRLLGAGALGLYEYAYRIPNMLFNRVANPVGAVLFPALSRVQDSDERLAAGYVKATRYIAIIALPMLGGLAVVAQPAVAVIWGEKWLPVVLPLQLLCLGAAMRCILMNSGLIFLCKNRPDLPFKFGLLQLGVTLVAVGGLGFAFGLNGIALGMVVSTSSGLYPAVFALRMVRSSLARLLSALWPSIAGTIGCTVLA
ncbi:MAG: lipopolysaccharide biosynthesis protein, partial [Chloroflexi bacterium]|nr:lipopolysaccharide biosynthesis protein [Chloroflexota bacterium]